MQQIIDFAPLVVFLVAYYLKDLYFATGTLMLAMLGMLAADAGSAAPLVISVGNLLIIALEVLVVSVQTTRLVLFEFFIRFFTGTGRAFRPAPPPPSDLQEPRHER